MPDSGVNLISQGQLQKGPCPLDIISEGMEIGNEKILAWFVNKNLYIPNLADSFFPSTAFRTINKDTL